MVSRSFSGSFSWNRVGFLAAVRRCSCFRLLFRQLRLVGHGRGDGGGLLVVELAGQVRGSQRHLIHVYL